MYTLKGIFPETKKDDRKNFIKENMKQLKYIQNKTPKEQRISLRSGQFSKQTNPTATGVALGNVKSSSSSRSGKMSCNMSKPTASNTRQKKRTSPVPIQKGDMAEFLKRKEMRNHKSSPHHDEELKSTGSSGLLRDIACQTIESSLAQKFADSRITVLYPMKDGDNELKLKASGDTGQHRCVQPSQQSPRKAGDELQRTEDILEYERQKSRLNTILEKKDNKDPYLPSGYQKGVIPKYLRERKEQGLRETEGIKTDDTQPICPPGHVTLPETERKETLRMLRNSFAELVNELNKMPVKTDTLRMRNRKMELEKQLSKLEEGIKVFSRPRVFVKIGE